MKRNFFAAIFMVVTALPFLASAQEAIFRFQPEPDFESIVNRTVASYRAQDAFQGLAECRLVDQKPVKPYTLKEAVVALEPCLKAVTARYNISVVAEERVLAPAADAKITGIALLLPPTVAINSKILRDLQSALKLRQNRLLGHVAEVRREARQEGPSVPGVIKSAAQTALNRCMGPAVLHRIKSGDDFTRIYGHCITRDPELKVSRIQPSVSDLSVTVFSAADRPVVESLNGVLSLNAENGPVNITVTAYSEMVRLP